MNENKVRRVLDLVEDLGQPALMSKGEYSEFLMDIIDGLQSRLEANNEEMDDE